MDETFFGYCDFPDGGCSPAVELYGAGEAWAYILLQMELWDRVFITDVTDCIVIESINNKIVFPKGIDEHKINYIKKNGIENMDADDVEDNKEEDEKELIELGKECKGKLEDLKEMEHNLREFHDFLLKDAEKQLKSNIRMNIFQYAVVAFITYVAYDSFTDGRYFSFVMMLVLICFNIYTNSKMNNSHKRLKQSIKKLSDV